MVWYFTCILENIVLTSKLGPHQCTTLIISLIEINDFWSMSPSFALLKHELLCLHKRRRANTKLCALYQSQCLAQKLEADNFVAGHWIHTASCIVWERRYYFIYDWWDLHIGNRSMYNSQHRKWVKIIDWNVISSILRYDRIVLYLILRWTFIL